MSSYIKYTYEAAVADDIHMYIVYAYSMHEHSGHIIANECVSVLCWPCTHYCTRIDTVSEPHILHYIYYIYCITYIVHTYVLAALTQSTVVAFIAVLTSAYIGR